MISTFWGIRTRLEFKEPSRLRLERNNTFLMCSNPSQCGISLSTSLSASLLLSVTTYDATKNHSYTSLCKIQISMYFHVCCFAPPNLWFSIIWKVFMGNETTIAPCRSIFQVDVDAVKVIPPKKISGLHFWIRIIDINRFQKSG